MAILNRLPYYVFESKNSTGIKDVTDKALVVVVDYNDDGTNDTKFYLKISDTGLTINSTIESAVNATNLIGVSSDWVDDYLKVNPLNNVNLANAALRLNYTSSVSNLLDLNNFGVLYLGESGSDAIIFNNDSIQSKTGNTSPQTASDLHLNPRGGNVKINALDSLLGDLYVRGNQVITEADLQWKSVGTSRTLQEPHIPIVGGGTEESTEVSKKIKFYPTLASAATEKEYSIFLNATDGNKFYAIINDGASERILLEHDRTELQTDINNKYISYTDHQHHDDTGVAGAYIQPNDSDSNDNYLLKSQLDVNYSNINHNHDSSYSNINHNHDGSYYQKSFIDANYYTQVECDANFSPITHDHDDRYHTQNYILLNYYTQVYIDKTFLSYVEAARTYMDSDLIRAHYLNKIDAGLIYKTIADGDKDYALKEHDHDDRYLTIDNKNNVKVSNMTVGSGDANEGGNLNIEAPSSGVNANLWLRRSSSVSGGALYLNSRNGDVQLDRYSTGSGPLGGVESFIRLKENGVVQIGSSAGGSSELPTMKTGSDYIRFGDFAIQWKKFRISGDTPTPVTWTLEFKDASYVVAVTQEGFVTHGGNDDIESVEIVKNTLNRKGLSVQTLAGGGADYIHIIAVGYVL